MGMPPNPEDGAPETAVIVNPAPTRIRGGEFNLDSRYGLKSLNTAQDKINLLIRIEEEKPLSARLTESARFFVRDCLEPILKCYRNHFDGNMDAFTAAYGNFSHSTFKVKCCKGEEESCQQSTP